VIKDKNAFRIFQKGYIKNQNYVNKIKNENNIKVITPLRCNNKTNNLNTE